MKGKCIYKKLTVTFDMSFAPEAAMVEWLEDRKVTRKDRLSNLMKDGLKLLMAEEDQT